MNNFAGRCGLEVAPGALARPAFSSLLIGLHRSANSLPVICEDRAYENGLRPFTDGAGRSPNQKEP